MKYSREYDYTDKYSDIVRTTRPVSAEELSRQFFSAPGWIRFLMRLRNAIVKPFGWKGKKDLSDLVHIESENTATISKNDKHLDLVIEFVSERMDNDIHRISVSTKVRFNNRMGRAYFAMIKPFHNMICKTLLKQAKNNIEK